MPPCPPKSDKDRTRWEHVIGKVLKDWASSIMREGHTRAEAREMILEELTNRKHPPEFIWIRIRKFLRVPFVRGWTIGYDWKNRAFLQFTKTDTYQNKYINWNFFFVRFSYSSLTYEGKEGRYFLNIGWDV